MSGIVYGVCGIGNGHLYRQLPLLDALAARGHRIAILAYSASLEYLRSHFAQNETVRVFPVAVPFYPGGRGGIDFAAAASRPENVQNYFEINSRAMAAARQFVGTTHLCVSDYEPVTAQYAYAYGVPLVTVDQQSKYLGSRFPVLGRYGYEDETMRLRMFFPAAARRLVASFFQIETTNPELTVVPPVLREMILDIAAAPSRVQERSLLVYLTAQRPLQQSLDSIALECQSVDATFDLYVPRNADLPEDEGNLRWHHHGDAGFGETLAQADGIVTTAGHTLLSEAMYLGHPVYAMPLPLHEQRLSATVIQEHGFGVAEQGVERVALARFVESLKTYRENIAADSRVLLRRPGQHDILAILETYLR